MEYMPGGRTLHERTRPENLLPLDEFIWVIFKCAKALDYAHRKGVIHRDVKPKNILLTDSGDIKVSDFSVALRTGLDVTDTQVHGYLGSSLYMSPEQVKGESLTACSDVFSLGVMMYELLTGKAPFAANTIATVTYQITAKAHTSVKEIRAKIPDTLEQILDQVLCKELAGRFTSAAELAAALSRSQDDLDDSEQDLSRHEKFKLVKGLSFFDEFTTSETWEVLNAAIWQEYEPADETIHEGKVDNSFFVIVRDTVAVRKGDTVVDRLKTGAALARRFLFPAEDAAPASSQQIVCRLSRFVRR
jgi:serine/threonine protein kinase